MVVKSVSVFIVIFIIIGGSFLILHYYMDAEGRGAEKHSAHQVPSKQVSDVKQTEAQLAEAKDKEKKNLEAVKKTQQRQAVYLFFTIFLKIGLMNCRSCLFLGVAQ